jgi:hypothetical protein
MADTPNQNVETTVAPIETGFKRFPFLKQEEKLKQIAFEKKITAEAAKEAAVAGEKRKALEQFSAEDKAFYDAVKKQELPEPEFKPTQDNAMELGSIV